MQRDDATTLPQASGRLDLEYLEGALARAGRAPPRGELEVDVLLGGRTGAVVRRVRVGDRSFVLKLVREQSWRVSGMGVARGGEHRLWAHGVTRSLAGPIVCPVIDVAYEPAGDCHWVLMDDVSAGIRDRGKFSRRDSLALVAGLAAMQAPLWDSADLVRAPLPDVTGPTDLLRKAVLHCSGRRTSDEPWLVGLLDDFKLLGAFLPLFLEQLGSELAEEFLTLADDTTWVTALGREPQTLLHGDLRRANIAFVQDRICLFDWELASRGPAGADLQWHCLLHYWAYPPDGVPAGDDCDDLAERYVAELETHRGRPIDRKTFDRGWQLGWIKTIVQVGYVLVDPLFPDGGDSETRHRIAALCRHATRRALHMRSRLTL